MKIVLENLTKIFPSRNKKSGEEVVAVNNFNFEIPDGKLIGLLGPSGCGKSTTLYMISGLQKPTSGRIFFGEDDVTELSTEKRGIGLVFQNYALYPHMTVLQNILFPLQNLTGADKLPKEKMLDRAREAAQSGADRRAAGPQAQRAFRRSAAARGYRPGAGEDASGAAAGRTPVQSGRAAASADSRGNSPHSERNRASPPCSSLTIRKKLCPSPT